MRAGNIIAVAYHSRKLPRIADSSRLVVRNAISSRIAPL
jgi:hypothetical protein